MKHSEMALIVNESEAVVFWKGNGALPVRSGGLDFLLRFASRQNEGEKNHLSTP